MAAVALVAAADNGVSTGSIVVVAVVGKPAGTVVVVAAAVAAAAVVMPVQTHNLFTVAVEECSML